MEGNLRSAEIEEERPEEDQDDGELPTIPPEKDPSSPRLTSPPLIKGHPNDKQMVWHNRSSVCFLEAPSPAIYINLNCI